MPKKATRIIQISDTHVFADARGELLGLRTRESFDAVIELAEQDANQADLVILTGDLSHDGTPESYRYIADRLNCIKLPIYWIPGNHDVMPMMEHALVETCLRADKELQFPGWRLLLLDSLDPDKVPGYLSEVELDKLTQFLKQSRQENLLLVLHHQPISVGSSWLDGVGLRNSDKFLAIATQSPNLRCIVFGHVHQAFDQVQHGIRYLGAPSTCIQFLPGSPNFVLDKVLPGYRYIELHADGTINTSVRRVTDFDASIDFYAEGY